MALYTDTLRMRAEFENEIRTDAGDLQAVLMALREVYQKEFLDSGLPVNDNTIGLLPAHAMSNIADLFGDSANSGIAFRNVSDTPRNRENQADEIEMEAIRYFRQNPEARDRFVPYYDSNGVPHYHFAAPLWVKGYCLNCHGQAEDAPLSIRARYKDGFDYELGELRGVMSIKLSASRIEQRIAAHRIDTLQHYGILFVFTFVLLGAGLHFGVTGRLARLQRAASLVERGEYGQSVKVDGKDEIAKLAESFNTMVSTVQQREQQLLEREALQRTVVQSSQDAIVMTDHRGHIRLFNPVAQRMFGYTEQEVSGESVSMLIPENLREAHLAGYKRYITNGETSMIDHGPIELTARRRDGEVFPIELNLGMGHKEEQSVFIASIRDVTERRRKSAEEQALGKLLRLAVAPLDLEEYLRQSLQTLLDSVNWLNFDGRAEVQLERPEGLVSSIKLDAQENQATPKDTATDPLPIDHQTISSRPLATDTCWSHILTDDKYLGKLVLGVTHEYRVNEPCQIFIQRAADVLGAGIQRRNIEADFEHQAYHDALTGLPNRRLLQDLVRQELAVTKRRHLHGALLFIDLDHFKTINDGLGHSVGDQLLIQVATRLRNELREGDTVTRIGGDEFVVLLPAMGDPGDDIAQQVLTVAEKLRLSIAQPYELNELTYRLTASIGVALIQPDIADCDEIMKHADTAMYDANACGRNRVCFYQPSLQAAADARLFLERELRDVVKRNELSLVYQAQVDTNGHLVGAEVLVRWHHPERGMISPAEFIPVAEDTGLIIEIGEWVFEQACRQAKHWATTGKIQSLSRLAINVSPRQFRQFGFVDFIRRLVNAHQPLPLRLELELTEGIAIDNVEDVIHKIAALKDLGVGMALDDFGTGYSSLAYLKRLPLDVLKIDQSFVRDVNRDPQDAAVVETILSMAKIMDVEVVAEGVEKEAEFAFLRERGCHFYQGYLFGKPMPAEKFEAWLDSVDVAAVQ